MLNPRFRLFQFYFINALIIQEQAMREWEDEDCGL